MSLILYLQCLLVPIDDAKEAGKMLEQVPPEIAAVNSDKEKLE